VGKIVCATRGGKASKQTQDAAIALARARNADLVFLFIVDTGFLDKTERAVRPDVVVEEMKHMGEFLLSMAQERAAAQGIQAQMSIRHGKVRQELMDAVKEEGADMLILGRPVGDDSAFRLAALQRLAAEIRNETGALVQLI
jgi:nucleotide-binding universal stress UspA family protein